MKKQIIVALALLVSTLSFAQKDEIKAAEKAIKTETLPMQSLQLVLLKDL